MASPRSLFSPLGQSSARKSAFFRSRIAVGLAATFGLLLTGLPAAYGQQLRASSAYGEKINVQLVPLLGNLPVINSGPQPAVSGTAGSAYDRAITVANLNVTTPLTGSLATAAIVSAHAAAGPNALDGAMAEAMITNPGLRLLGTLPLVTLTSDEISSSVAVGGVCLEGTSGIGSSRLANARLGGLVGNIPIPLNPAPNTVLLNTLGVKVVLNEQIAERRGTSTTLTVNAIHISIAGALTSLGLLNADVVLAQSKAQADCQVPGTDLILTKTAPATANVGQIFDYTLTVRNVGAENASGVTLTDLVPAEFLVSSFSSSQGNCSQSDVVVCELGDIAAGDSAVVIISGFAPNIGTVVNTARVSTLAAESSLLNNLASATVSVRNAPQI